MGNCVHVLSKLEKVRVVTSNGKVQEFKGLTPVKKITSSEAYKGYNLVHHSQPFSPLPPKTKLEPGEVYFLVPDMARFLVSPKVLDIDENKEMICGRQKITIVVPGEKLLEFLLRSSSKQLQCRDVCVRVSSESFFGFEEGSPKWRPSLSSIAEAGGF